MMENKQVKGSSLCMITKAVLKKSVCDTIIRYCTDKKPHEACGFLLGQTEYARVTVTDFLPVPNIAVNPSESFDMDPAVIIPIVTNASVCSYCIVGLLHSHPTAEAIPSAQDLRTLWKHIPTHWIVSFKQPEQYDMRVYSYITTSSSTSFVTESAADYSEISLIVQDD